MLGQVTQGREADLKKGFGEEERKRRLSAGFLEKLLAGGFQTVRVPHQGVKIANAIIDDPLNLEYTEVDYPLSLSHCIFNKPVTFQESSFKKDLTLTGSIFLDSANFKGIKVDGSVFCNEVIFGREGLWCDAKIGKNFDAQKVQFKSYTGKADFNGMKVESNAYFTSAKFSGPVDFGIVHIGRQFNMNEAEFFNAKETVNFISLKVDQIAYFKGVRFHGPVDFAIAQIGIQFNADGAEFLHPDKLANFSGIKVGNTIYFQGAQFQGPAKFEFAEIGVNFRATGAGFLNACQPKNLSKMKVGHKVFLNGAIILCNLDMSYGEFYDLEINGSLKDDPAEPPVSVNLPLLKLKGSVVNRDLKIANVKIGELRRQLHAGEGPYPVRQCRDRHSGGLPEQCLPESLCLPRSNGRRWIKSKKIRNVYLGELTYSSIDIDKQGGGDLAKVISARLRNLSKPAPSIVRAMSNWKASSSGSVKSPGLIRSISTCAIGNCPRRWPWWDPRRWLEWFFWGVLAGHGRAPFRVFFISMLLIILGAVLYDPEHLKPRNPPGSGKSSDQ